MRPLLASMLFFVSTNAWAQPAPSARPVLLQLNMVKVKPEYVSEFIELQKTAIVPSAKKSGTAWRSAWRTSTFGNSHTFAFTTPIDDFAGYDSPPEVVAEIAARFPKYVSDRDSYALIYRRELSKEFPPGQNPGVAILTAVEVAPGRQTAYEAYVKNEVLPYMSDPKAGIQGFGVYETVLGGPVSWFLIVYVENMAYLDGGPPATRVLGESGQRALVEKTAGLVNRVERTVWRYLPELSFGTAEGTSSNQPE